MTIFGLFFGFMIIFAGIIGLTTTAFGLLGPILIATGVIRILTHLHEWRAQKEKGLRDDFRPYHFKDEAEILAEKYERM